MSLHDLITYDFFHHYQPIYDIQAGEIVGYEGLFRTEKRINPELTFKLARKHNMLYTLDSMSATKALQSFIQAGYTCKRDRLFLNVFPSTLVNSLFFNHINKIIDDSVLSSKQIIFEINESEFMNIKFLKRAIKQYKELGFQIAIDDFGKGFSSLESLIELEPEYLKVDQFIMKNFYQSSKKQMLLQQILHYCKKFNLDLIVEGVEENNSLNLLKKMGIQYTQGFLFGKPSLLPLKKMIKAGQD